ncbi:hypothetical protein BV20DRAFT_960054 [Pilatotrama ljubarskyi]|nr:hypothetical protein BV20DRAFT_960054 [Pilatotrama ljubarskyi]
MALNWATLSPSRQPTPLPHELTIRTIDSGVELSLQIPDAPPSGAATSGGSGGAKKLKEVGRIWLTDQRLIFVSDLPSKGAPSFDSLSVPLTSLVSTKFEQPRFGANYLSLDIKASPGGGLVDGTRAEVRFKDKGLFEFTSALEKTRERAIYMKRQSADEEEGLPAYTTPGPSGSSSPYVTGDIPDENPPGYDD